MITAGNIVFPAASDNKRFYLHIILHIFFDTAHGCIALPIKMEHYISFIRYIAAASGGF